MKAGFLILISLFYCGSICSQGFIRTEQVVKLSELSHTTGVAVADIDRDNDLDLFVVAKRNYEESDPSTWSRLFLNNNDGTFTDGTDESGLESINQSIADDPGWDFGVNMGASWGDYDNDGFPDLFLTNYKKLQLFHNQGDGTFKDASHEAGFGINSSCYYTSALWWDFDNDGYLDLYISKWGFCESNEMYRNNRDGTFSQINDLTGLGGQMDKTWMSIPLDINHDGRCDLYLANDIDENELFIQNQDQSFTEQAKFYHANQDGNDMGMTIGDYNNDGLFDVYITNISENRLLTQLPDHSFSDDARNKDVLNTYWAWGTKFMDFDHDGDEDLFVANGYQKDAFFYPTLKTNFLYKNLYQEGEESFVDWTKEANLYEFSNSMGMEAFDYDNDGDLDILVSNMDDAPFFYTNQTITNQTDPNLNWVKIQLEGVISNRDGLGSKVKISSNGDHQYRYYQGAGFLSQSLQPIHFGLSNFSIIDSLTISWPSGIEETYHNLPVNSTIKLTETQGYETYNSSGIQIPICTEPYYFPYPNPLKPSEALTIPYTHENQSFTVLDTQGKPVEISEIIYNENRHCSSLIFKNLKKGMYLLSTEGQTWKIAVLD